MYRIIEIMNTCIHKYIYIYIRKHKYKFMHTHFLGPQKEGTFKTKTKSIDFEIMNVTSQRNCTVCYVHSYFYIRENSMRANEPTS